MTVKSDRHLLWELVETGVTLSFFISVKKNYNNKMDNYSSD
jgi:hypothetical protein